MHPVAKPVDVRKEFVLPSNDELGSRRGCRRPEVGDEVGDGHVGFVAHSADHRHSRASQGARDHFFVEGPEIL
jgi:hypothetical protein